MQWVQTTTASFVWQQKSLTTCGVVSGLAPRVITVPLGPSNDAPRADRRPTDRPVHWCRDRAFSRGSGHFSCRLGIWSRARGAYGTGSAHETGSAHQTGSAYETRHARQTRQCLQCRHWRVSFAWPTKRARQRPAWRDRALELSTGQRLTLWISGVFCLVNMVS